MNSIKSYIVDKLVEFKIKIDRGNSIVYWVKNLILMVAGISLIVGGLGVTASIILGIGLIVAIFLIGYIDIHYLHSYQREAELITGKYNPVFKKFFGVVHDA